MVTEGFVGMFGNNGYNSTKTRGVLLGNMSQFGEERGSRIELGSETRTRNLPSTANTIFMRAGFADNNKGAAVPAYTESAPVTAGAFVVGRQYQIVTPSNTDFTLIGAANNNAGTVFVANGAGSGTGTARETSFGRPFTTGPGGRPYNIIITTESNNSSNAAPLGLNIGLVSYASGISPEYGFSITTNVVL
jgi:hypothetical protein